MKSTTIIAFDQNQEIIEAPVLLVFCLRKNPERKTGDTIGR